MFWVPKHSGGLDSKGFRCSGFPRIREDWVPKDSGVVGPKGFGRIGFRNSGFQSIQEFYQRLNNCYIPSGQNRQFGEVFSHKSFLKRQVTNVARNCF